MKITLTSLTQQKLKELLTTTPVFYGFYTLPVGTLFICTVNNSIIEAAFCDKHDQATVNQILKKYPHKKILDTKELQAILQQPLSLLVSGTEFQNNVWRAALQVPAGTTSSYKKIAQQIGKPTAYRAVANALAQNHIAYFIPCHRVTLSNGNLCGYRWGIEIKAALLRCEKQEKRLPL